MISVTSVEAQNRFGQLLDMARREPVTVTRHGRPAGRFYRVATGHGGIAYVRIRRSKAVDALQAWSEKAGRLATPAAAELSDDDINRLVHELRP